MRLSKLVAVPVVALLLGLGLASSAPAAPAEARGLNAHAPIACKLGGGTEPDGTGICGIRDRELGGNSIKWDARLYQDYKDFSPYAPIADPRIFPRSDQGLDCDLSDSGRLECSRTGANAPFPGQSACSLSQLKDVNSYGCRGSVIDATVDADKPCSTSSQVKVCNLVTVFYGDDGSGRARYYTEALQFYNSDGLPTVPYVRWYRNDGKGPGHKGTVLGTTQGYLTAPSASDAPASTVIATSHLSPGEVVGRGARVDYSVGAQALSAGSTLVRLHTIGLGSAIEDSVPTGWTRLSTLDSEDIDYFVPHLDAGETTTLTMHFTVVGLGVSVGAFVNNTSISAQTSVRPAAPVCSKPDNRDDGIPVVPVGGEVTQLEGVFCSTTADNTLQFWRGEQAGDGQLTIPGNSLGSPVYYQARDSVYSGRDALYVYAMNEAGKASLPTRIDVNVATPAVAVPDEFTAPEDEMLRVDAAHGVMANDMFTTGQDGWTTQLGDLPRHGHLQLGPHGEIVYSASPGYTGDDEFRYRLSGPHGTNSEPVTVTMHVTG